ncbi:MAG: hypothetical protein WC285_04545 [Candidatus Gracilibacteria bacterium]|jgi:hypothetical protein
MKRTNLDINQLKRNKYTSAEEKLDWLYSALEFGKTKKNVVGMKKG